MTPFTVGYSDFDAPFDGRGVFTELFNGGRNLRYVSSIHEVDAILLWGGDDISTSLYKEEPAHNGWGPPEPSMRDLYEWHILREAVRAKKPIIGICRGAQLICAFAGGKLVQNMSGHHGDHDVLTHDGKILTTKSSHHQMMYPYNVNHDLLAWCEEPLSTIYEPQSWYTDGFEKATDKEPEVVYFTDINAMAIQGHPEWDTKDSPFNRWVFQQIREYCFKKEC